MNRYAVGYASFITEEIQVEIVIAKNHVDAINKHSMLDGHKLYSDNIEVVKQQFRSAGALLDVVKIKEIHPSMIYNNPNI